MHFTFVGWLDLQKVIFVQAQHFETIYIYAWTSHTIYISDYSLDIKNNLFQRDWLFERLKADLQCIVVYTSYFLWD
jgi:hypothetical protein